MRHKNIETKVDENSEWKKKLNHKDVQSMFEGYDFNHIYKP